MVFDTVNGPVLWIPLQHVPAVRCTAVELTRLCLSCCRVTYVGPAGVCGSLADQGRL
jgi:hypothetical protein